MSTKPFGFPNVPIPGIETVTPVPDGSVMDHARRTVALPPIQTAFGVAVKELIPGAGHAVAVTVLCALAELPHPLFAISVYVVVDCGWLMSTKPLPPAKLPTPGIVTVKPVPVPSLTDHASRTI